MYAYICIYMSIHMYSGKSQHSVRINGEIQQRWKPKKIKSNGRNEKYIKYKEFISCF